MKVAVLLRGETKFIKESSLLFDTLVRKRFPHIDFKIFAHTWNSYTETTINKDAIKYSLPVFGTKIKSIDDTLIELSNVKPNRLYISRASELLKCCASIILEMYSDTELNTWLTSYLGDNLHNNNYLDFLVPPPAGKHSCDVEKFMSLKLFYFLGQYVSAIHAQNVLLEYIKKEDNTYKPDLIWNTRYDVVHLIGSDTFENILNQLIIENKNPFTPANIITSKVAIFNNISRLTDWNFFYKFDNFTKNVVSPYEIMIEIFKTKKIKLLSHFDNEYLQTSFWTNVFEKHSIFAMNNTICFAPQVLRFTSDFSLIPKILEEHNKDLPDNTTLFQFFATCSNYAKVRSTFNVGIDNETVLNIYNNIMAS